jgi:hypothetical protein
MQPYLLITTVQLGARRVANAWAGIAIGEADKVVFAKGYGTRKLDDCAPFNVRTICAIGAARRFDNHQVGDPG